MAEQAHFKYEGNHADVVRPSQVEEATITAVKFLVPVNVSYKVGDRELNAVGSVDYINKRIYFQGGEDEKLEKKVFEFLSSSTTLPEDSYEAPAEVYEQAGRAHEAHDEYDNLQQDFGGSE